MDDEHYGDYSMRKWDDYAAAPKKTAREEWIHKVHNDTYRARSLIRNSYKIIPPEALTKEIIDQYCVLENLLTEQWNIWKEMK